MIGNLGISALQPSDQVPASLQLLCARRLSRIIQDDNVDIKKLLRHNQTGSTIQQFILDEIVALGKLDDYSLKKIAMLLGDGFAKLNAGSKLTVKGIAEYLADRSRNDSLMALDLLNLPNLQRNCPTVDLTQTENLRVLKIRSSHIDLFQINIGSNSNLVVLVVLFEKHGKPQNMSKLFFAQAETNDPVSNLKYLDISNAGLTHVPSLNSLSRISTLILYNVPQLQHWFREICELKALCSLDISQADKSSSKYVDPSLQLNLLVENLPKLDHLDISGTNLARGSTTARNHSGIHNCSFSTAAPRFMRC